MNAAKTIRFEQARVERALDLVNAVNAHRHEMNGIKDDQRKLLCQFWACRAKELLEQEPEQDDQEACLWVLHIVRGIASAYSLYIHGLGQDQQGDWGSLRRVAGGRLRAHWKREAAGPDAFVKARPVVVEVPALQRGENRSFPKLMGAKLPVVGGEHDLPVLDRHRQAGIDLEWVPGSVRQVEACADRIRRGGVDGVIFLTDRNPHKFQKIVRDACRASNTPFEFSASGIGSIESALQRLNDRSEPMPASV